MNAEDVLTILQGQGYKLTVENGGLQVRGPGPPPDTIAQAIAEHREVLIEAVELAHPHQPERYDVLVADRIVGLAQDFGDGPPERSPTRKRSSWWPRAEGKEL